MLRPVLFATTILFTLACNSAPSGAAPPAAASTAAVQTVLKGVPQGSELTPVLTGHPEKVTAIATAAFSAYPRNAPPSLASIQKLPDGNFEVLVQRVDFETKTTVESKKVVVAADGSVVRVETK